MDADAACVDAIDSIWNEEGPVWDFFGGPGAALGAELGCVLAWQGSVREEPSTVLNWAFGCAARHALALAALEESARRVLHVQQHGAGSPSTAHFHFFFSPSSAFFRTGRRGGSAKTPLASFIAKRRQRGLFFKCKGRQAS